MPPKDLHDSNNIRTNFIAPFMGKQSAHSAEVGALAPKIEKSVIESKSKPKLNLLRCNIIQFNDINQLPEFTTSSIKLTELQIDKICIGEHSYQQNEQHMPGHW